MGCLVGEVENRARVDGITHEAGFEVQVRACAAACASAKGNRVAHFDILVRFYKELGEVTVDGLKSVLVADDYVVAVTSALIFCESYFSGECGADSVAGLEFQVYALVIAAETRTVAVG